MLLAEAELDNSLGSGGPGEVGPGWPGGRAQGGPGRWAQGGLGSRVVQPGFSMQHAACRMHVDRKLAFRALFLFSFSLSNCSHLFSFLFPPPWLKPSCSPLCWSFCLSFFFAFCIYIFPEKVLLRSAHESGNARRTDLASPRWGSAACMHRLASPRWGLPHARSRVHETEYYAGALLQKKRDPRQVATARPSPLRRGGDTRTVKRQTDIYEYLITMTTSMWSRM